MFKIPSAPNTLIFHNIFLVERLGVKPRSLSFTLG
nr:MAG TPA: hypothetical protein [Caudoviricetes sp.]DAS75366.1 MAG TPA: hypothetical protein [Caudoviricetes sp.]DAV17825.1 MAG TPA: hypothetical protein [Caudoviricetes sp.]